MLILKSEQDDSRKVFSTLVLASVSLRDLKRKLLTGMKVGIFLRLLNTAQSIFNMNFYYLIFVAELFQKVSPNI